MLPRKPIIQLKNFSFSYERNKPPIFNQLNLSIYENEMTLLMGPSGSGKSTLALCLNGLYPEAVEGFSEGDILYHGKNVHSFSKGELNQKIGIVFQDPESQFCMIRVEDELAFTLENLSIPANEMRPRIEEALDLVGMTEYIDHKVHELSGGEKQKIALAAILLMEPELIILDEPTANLDPASSIEFIEVINKLQDKLKMSVLIIEHQVDHWINHLDRIVALNQSGKVIADEHPNIMFSNHSSLLQKTGIMLPKILSTPKTNHRPKLQLKRKTCLSVKELSFFRKDKVILKDVSFDINEGEFVAIVGQNGAGKSTLLQLLNRLLEPEYGDILLLNKPLGEWSEAELRMKTGFVFQNPEHQFITDTVYDEITFGMRLNNYRDEDIEDISSRLLETFRLTEHKWSNPFSLSGGEKRRLSVATMLDESPNLLFFDEPTFGQDGHTTQELMKIVQQLNHKGVAIIFVTHDMDLVNQYCDRVIVLNDGQIAFNDMPHKLWENNQLLNEARLIKPLRLKQKEAEMSNDYIYQS
ncbi:ABC transporter ATP-binding protein [Bacillaceae bacterium W0354]